MRCPVEGWTFARDPTFPCRSTRGTRNGSPFSRTLRPDSPNAGVPAPEGGEAVRGVGATVTGIGFGDRGAHFVGEVVVGDADGIGLSGLADGGV